MPVDTLNKNGTQQKKHHLIPFENNGTLQKWHMTNTPLKINKYNNQKNGALQKWHKLRKNAKGWAEWFLKGSF